MAQKVLVEVKEMKKTFLHQEKQLHILRGINLTIEQGETLSVVGMSGAGKSTFLHVLGTLDVPTSGKIFFNGVDIFSLPPDEIARFRNHTIGFVFQFHHLLPEFSALENVQMPCLIARLTKQEAKRRAEELLERVGLKERMAHRPSELSGGEQQRVALARALVMRPRLLLADEPTGNLDSRTSGGVHQLFSELNESLDIAMMIVTHNPTLANIAKRQLQMIDGRLEEITQPPKQSELVETEAVAYSLAEPLLPTEPLEEEPVAAPSPPVEAPLPEKQATEEKSEAAKPTEEAAPPAQIPEEPAPNS